MISTRFVVIVGLIIILLIGYFSIRNGSFEYNNKQEHNDPTINREINELEEELRAKYENYWDALPITEGNPLYVDPMKDINKFSALTLSFLKSLIILPLPEYNKETVFEPLMRKYVDLIGWNGVFDVVDEAQKQLGTDSADRLHWLGEQLYEASKEYSPHFGIEIASRNTLHKAPLHGLVWKHIEAFGVSDLKKFKKFIDEELCYFKYVEGLGDAYVSCEYQK